MATILATINQKIIWRLVVVHVAAVVFLVLASKQLAVLNDPALLSSVEKYGVDEGINQSEKAGNFASRLAYFQVWLIISVSIGMLLGIILSATIIVQRKLHWLNIVVMILAVIIVVKSGLYQSAFIERMINLPGYVLSEANIIYKYIFTGTIPLLISLVLFFNKRITNWTKGYQRGIVTEPIPVKG